jgi:4'-phosphopantetheinyl transferase
MIDIYYSDVSEKPPLEVYHKYLSLLPCFLRDRNLRYETFNGRLSHFLGRLLLITGMEKIGFGPEYLNKLYYNEYGRPYLPGTIHFSISHSADYVICAVTSECSIGVDIEKIRCINVNAFKKIMSLDQWMAIMNSHNPLDGFFRLWTIRESVIKAYGKGRVSDLLNVQLIDDYVIPGEQKWFLKELPIDVYYSSFLASSKKMDDTVLLHKISF